ncbi:phage tail domain-containing protein [Streptomyces sp. NBC_00847]|uniref:phage distal tail protein n=1 Tax=Streptomyces sp. NBC_00847 TaxID=2975850 RepID=UPI00225E1E01|nr:phage tail domain-containing protein [Streptomyces sp. NBC_00847]MCX4886091.1 phage tail family protein [Streptomyces sp. NBC_00847]
MPYTPGAALDGLQATLGNVALGAVDSAGVAWYLQSLEGWDSPDNRSEFTEREGDHGAWASPVYLGARPITLAGTIVAPSRPALETAMDQLRGAAGLTDTVLTVAESVPKQATVRRSGKPLMQYVTDSKATYSVMVTAADPRRYSTTLQTQTTGLPVASGGLSFPVTFPITFSGTGGPGQVTAVNVGDFETRPVLTLAGPVVAPLISALYADGSVRQLVYSQNLAIGDVLTIDTDAHTVLINGGVSRRRFMTVASGWPTISAGQSVTYLFQSSTYSATATLTVQWRSAWM